MVAIKSTLAFSLVTGDSLNLIVLTDSLGEEVKLILEEWRKRVDFAYEIRDPREKIQVSLVKTG